MKSNNTKFTKPKILIILSAVTVAAFLLTAFILAYPKINAEKELNSIGRLISSAEIDGIFIYQHTPFETGSFDQISQVLERKLDADEEEKLAQLFSEVISIADYTGLSESYYSMTDYKIIVAHKNGKTAFYVSEDSVYILEGSLKTSFKCDNNPLYEYLNTVKHSHFSEN